MEQINQTHHHGYSLQAGKFKGGFLFLFVSIVVICKAEIWSP